MAKIETAFFDIGTLDTLAGGDTPLHRLDPRAKLVTTLVFVVTVVSFGRYQIAALLPFALFPMALILRGELPAGYLGKKLLIAAPFAFFVGILNPWLDPAPLLHFGGVTVSGGWVSFASILLRFGLTVSAALVLIATTSFAGVCMALEKLGAPKIFALQLLFLYRYLFVLVDEGQRLVRARALRSFAGRGMGMKIFGHLIGQLLLRTVDRAQRIHLAMLCRGFDGDIRLLRRSHIGRPEVIFTLGWSAAFIALRLFNLPHLLGTLLTELFR
ncbi:cobalt ABC transporter, permease protein CbiQ [Desulfuromonas soudanensis]|uniref:Cobalt ABC transporter, permease protein CbiQ n=1 Tax=Desulfuromonas soudanensis TaxID=1603606 RepID=A0A0M3QF14_9BACT|nr:cobalt ECF transporter T component CbiQ [Desulfuromonas soudanensis]ALC15429.1 cobalt ABC transporter, permease protein CbiQ [Desulfuromonas soudanensis]